MSVYDPNAPAIPKPTKLSSPVMLAGTDVWEEPYNLVQLFGSVVSHLNKWRMFYVYQRGVDAIGNRLWNAAYAEADNPQGPWRKPSIKYYNGLNGNAIIGDQQSWGVFYSPTRQKFLGAGYAKRGESINGGEWHPVDNWPEAGQNDTSTSVIQHQPFYQGNPFIAGVRAQGTWANGTLRRAAWMDSGNWDTWSAKNIIEQFDSPDGWEQPYALQLTSHGEYIVGLLWWLHLDNTSGNNSVGTVDAELVWLKPPANAISIAQCGSWTRTYQPFLSIGAAGAWDAGTVQPAPLVIHDGTVYCFYTGFKQKHGISMQPHDLNIGLATMAQLDLDGILQ